MTRTKQIALTLSLAIAVSLGALASPANAQLVIGEQQDYFRSCTGWYRATWGGFEYACAWDRYSQGVHTSQIVQFIYWDGNCRRYYKWASRLLDYQNPRPWTEYRLAAPYCV